MKKYLPLLLLILPLFALAQIQAPSYPADKGRIHLDTTIQLDRFDQTAFLVAADGWFVSNFGGRRSRIVQKSPADFQAQGHWAFTTFLGGEGTSISCRAKFQLTPLPGNKLRVQFTDYRLEKNGGYWKDRHWITDKKVFRKNGTMRYVKGEFRTKTVQSMYAHLASLQQFLAGI